MRFRSKEHEPAQTLVLVDVSFGGLRLYSAISYQPPTPEAVIPLTLTYEVVLLMGAGQI